MLKIRSATLSDLAALDHMGAVLARLHHGWDHERFMLPEGVERGYRQWFERELQNPEAVLIVAHVDDEVVGYAYGRLEERDWNALLDAHGAFHDLWVDDRARRLGVGRALAAEMIERLTALGAPRIVLVTSPHNAAAQRLFAGLGWRTTMIEMTREVGPGCDSGGKGVMAG